MKNITKVGLSALAGSLVAFSANAVDMSVSGTAEVTYTTNSGTGNNATGATGNPWGSNKAISFTGTGDVGFGTAKIVRTLNDNVSANWLSAWQTIDMGDLGKLSFDAVGGGLEGTSAYDDILPMRNRFGKPSSTRFVGIICVDKDQCHDSKITICKR